MTFKGYLAIVAGLFIGLPWLASIEAAKPPAPPGKPHQQQAIEAIGGICSGISRLRELPYEGFLSEKPSAVVVCNEGSYYFRVSDRKAWPLFCGAVHAERAPNCFPGYCQNSGNGEGMNAEERARCAFFPTEWKWLHKRS